MVNLLRAVSSSADEISLAGVLRSPIFSLEDETLFWLGREGNGISAALFAKELPPELSTQQQVCTKFAAGTLRHLRAMKDRVPIAVLLDEALAITGYDATLLAEFMGERKLANLRKLMEQARAFDRSGVLGLSDFIVQLAEFVARQPREALAATYPEDAEVVRLMTIHQAKGLEFPVVFLSDIDRRENSDRDTAAWDPDLGPLVKTSSDDGDNSINGLKMYRFVGRSEAEAETARLLYVATTRAADYLVLSAGICNFDNPTGSWAKLLAQRFDLRTGASIALPGADDAAQRGGPLVKVTMDSNGGCAAEKSRRVDLNAMLEQSAEIAANCSRKNAWPVSPDFALPLEVDRTVRRRFSVSRLNGHLQIVRDANEERAVADDALPSAASAADFGTLVHRVLSRLDCANGSNLNELIDRFVKTAETERGSEGATQADETRHLVKQFLDSPRCRAIAVAAKVYRELEFLLVWHPAKGSLTTPDDRRTPASGARYLQGFIDCLYQDANAKWHLLDYKTNNVLPDDVSKAAAGYEMQLGVYAFAVEKILGESPAELAVHFLRPAKEFVFKWDDQMRRRTEELVNQAIDAAVNEVTRADR